MPLWFVLSCIGVGIATSTWLVIDAVRTERRERQMRRSILETERRRDQYRANRAQFFQSKRP